MSVDLYRNGIKEVSIVSNKSPEIAAYLKGVLPKDYYEFMKFKDLKELPHLKSWLEDFLHLMWSFPTEDSKIFEGVKIL